MNKELIDKLRLMAFESVDNDEATMLHEAADALEAMAAPVGEREAAIEAAYAAVADGGWTSVKDMGIQMFQAGAAYQRQSGEHGDAYQGAREDLAIWKRRALEAEARVRQQDQIIDQMGEDLNAINGPTFMGEPVLPSERQSGVMPPAEKLADLFIGCPLPKTVRVDPCAIDPDYPHRFGTNLLTWREAKTMFEEMFARLNGAGSHE